MKVLTILIPVLNEEVNLPILYSRLTKVLDGLKKTSGRSDNPRQLQ